MFGHQFGGQHWFACHLRVFHLVAVLDIFESIEELVMHLVEVGNAVEDGVQVVGWEESIISSRSRRAERFHVLKENERNSGQWFA